MRAYDKITTFYKKLIRDGMQRVGVEYVLLLMTGILGVRKTYLREHANGRAFPGDRELPSGLVVILRHLECEVAKGHGEDVQLQLERI